MKIRTSFDYPPIPNRSFDWSAIDDDTYDGAPDSSTRHQIGHGATEQEAVADLMEMLEAKLDAIAEQALRLAQGEKHTPSNSTERLAANMAELVESAAETMNASEFKRAEKRSDEIIRRAQGEK